MSTKFEAAVTAAHYAISSASSENHNINTLSVVIAVLEAIREPDEAMQACIETARPYLVAFPNSAPETFWGQMIDVLLAEARGEK